MTNISPEKLPDNDTYYMGIAFAVRQRANCTGNRVGAVKAGLRQKCAVRERDRVEAFAPAADVDPDDVARTFAIFPIQQRQSVSP